MDSLQIEKDGFGIVTIRLNKPELHNAFDEQLIADLTTCLQAFDKDDAVRVVVLAANGPSFSAGADLGWMKKMAGYSVEENLQDAKKLAELMRVLNGLSKPTIAKVQGSAFGGGVGLIACCDIAVASDKALFALSEARLGLIPAVISPYVIAAMGERASRRYFLSGERFSADVAQLYGLVHEVVDADDLDESVDQITSALLECGPDAQKESKRLIAKVAGRLKDPDLIEETAHKIAAIRASQEGREGISAFLEKRAPKWLKKKA